MTVHEPFHPIRSDKIRCVGDEGDQGPSAPDWNVVSGVSVLGLFDLVVLHGFGTRDWHWYVPEYDAILVSWIGLFFGGGAGIAYLGGECGVFDKVGMSE